MPIRFRCAYCNQLMGIARRKAGTVVRCPSCASQVTVPQPEAGEPVPRPRPDKDPAAPLFERSDFDEIFNQGPARPKRPEASPFAFDAPEPAPVPELIDVYKKPEPPLPEPAPREPAPVKSPIPAPPATDVTSNRPGIWLTPGLATLLSVAAVVALALAFAAGLLVGIYIQPARDDQSRRPAESPSLAWIELPPR